jgi:hypothetical protein
MIKVLAADAATNAAGDFVWPVTSYYHLGYHVVLAALASVFGSDISTLMLVSGQLVLAALPIPLYFFARRETGSVEAGILAVVLATFGWSMPAAAVNWGKYPALFGLPLVLFTLGVLYSVRSASRGRARTRLLLLAYVGSAAALMIHSRAIILLLIGALSWLASGWGYSVSLVRRRLIAGILLVGLILEVVSLAHSTVLSPVLDPYLHPGAAVLLLTGLLFALGLWNGSRLAFSALGGIAALLLALIVPLPPGLPTTLLDRPLVEMVLFVPLALACAAGLTPLWDLMHARTGHWRAGVTAALSLGVALHAVCAYRFQPSSCCNLVGDPDIPAMDWISRQLPADARLLIPSSQLAVLPVAYAPLDAGSDAAIWIGPLTGRATVSLPAGTDFLAPQTLRVLCEHGVDAIYAGDSPHSFSSSSLESAPDWYDPILDLETVRIYRVSGCASLHLWSGEPLVSVRVHRKQ